MSPPRVGTTGSAQVIILCVPQLSLAKQNLSDTKQAGLLLDRTRVKTNKTHVAFPNVSCVPFKMRSNVR